LFTLWEAAQPILSFCTGLATGNHKSEIESPK
jgi:hypothetical protein